METACCACFCCSCDWCLSVSFLKNRQAVRTKRIMLILMAKIPIETQPFCTHKPGRGRQRSETQKLLELLGDGRRYDYHRMLSHFPPIIPNWRVMPLKKTRS